MRALFVVAACGLCLLSAQGCKSAGNSVGVEVVIDGGGAFPEALAGRWKAEDSKLEITFEANGTISSAVIRLGRVRLEPGKETIVPMLDGGQGVYEPGEWYVFYSPQSCELAVTIVVDSFEAQIGDDTVRGSVDYYYAGTVSSETGTWNAELISMPKYIVDTKQHKDYELPMDSEVEAVPVVFKKVEDK